MRVTISTCQNYARCSEGFEWEIMGIMIYRKRQGEPDKEIFYGKETSFYMAAAAGGTRSNAYVHKGKKIILT